MTAVRLADVEEERRGLVNGIEFRSNGPRLVASGVAIRYGSVSKDLGGFRERIMPGAATKSLKERDVLALHEHDRKMFLGRVSSGTLRVHDTPTELAYEVDLPDTTAGRDVAALLERGDVKGSSFGFKAVPAATRWTNEDGHALRTVGEMMLDHVSTTCYPAYNETSAEVALRTLAAQTGVEVRSLLAAAESGALAALIGPVGRDSAHDPSTAGNADADWLRREIRRVTVGAPAPKPPRRPGMWWAH